jgi:hypothetical protein
MIKYGQYVLLPCLKKVFNLIMESGKYPKTWVLDTWYQFTRVMQSQTLIITGVLPSTAASAKYLIVY